MTQWLLLTDGSLLNAAFVITIIRNDRGLLCAETKDDLFKLREQDIDAVMAAFIDRRPIIGLVTQEEETTP